MNTRGSEGVRRGLGTLREHGDAAPFLEKAMLRQLASCSWITEHLNVLITGGTGVGKGYLACALAQSASRSG
jgi:DNA replication protein DnaC